ncbi:DUF551 domain-containing protein [Zoogloea sp.]|uniref:DUF551 domain-containing protein n=1 Tax=Zoogloea sp. TaxID=49181 RepID=UPI0025EF2264|nr:DUF551 domain-containing protein [Zoogloea sp.]MCK6396043.1 DUF551 domain-containing protein [Zoogloea sp.]
MSAATNDYADEAPELVDFLHRQSAFFRKHGGTVLKDDAQKLADAASLLDSYRAGLVLTDPLPALGVELIRWVSVSKAVPDADETALLRIVGPTETYVWAGYYDGERWVSAEGVPLGGDVVTHWAEFPAGPAVSDAAEEAA